MGWALEKASFWRRDLNRVLKAWIQVGKDSKHAQREVRRLRVSG